VVVEERGGRIRRGVEEGSRLLLAGFHLDAATRVGRPPALHRGGAVLLDYVMGTRMGMWESASCASLLWPGRVYTSMGVIINK
jgi:hypothetical protein